MLLIRQKMALLKEGEGGGIPLFIFSIMDIINTSAFTKGAKK
jgi:hypothetical protein